MMRIVLLLLFKSRALGLCIWRQRRIESEPDSVSPSILWKNKILYLYLNATNAPCFYGYSIVVDRCRLTHAVAPADVPTSLHFSTSVALPPPTVFTCLRLRPAVPFNFHATFPFYYPYFLKRSITHLMVYEIFNQLSMCCVSILRGLVRSIVPAAKHDVKCIERIRHRET